MTPLRKNCCPSKERSSWWQNLHFIIVSHIAEIAMAKTTVVVQQVVGSMAVANVRCVQGHKMQWESQRHMAQCHGAI